MFNSPGYRASPIWIQNLLLSGRAAVRKALRENRGSRNIQSSIAALERDHAALNEFHHKQLSRILSLAIQTIPYYQSIKGLDATSLESFPVISKNDILSRPDDFRNTAYSGMQVHGSTSGTTGTPLSVPQSMESVIREQAFISRSLLWAGFEPGDRRAWLRGDLIVPIAQSKPPFWRYSVPDRMILLSSFHMTRNALSMYLDKMADFNTRIIQAYPSSIVTLAKFLELSSRRYGGDLKSIVTSSESLNEEDRKLVEDRFDCKIIDWYGQFERVAAISNCEFSRYHVLTDYSHVEFLQSDDGRFEIVGTNFNNELYPLIRYRTGDFVTLSDESSCPCGRVYPLVDRIEGRIGDYLIAEGGQKVHILNHIPKGVNGLLGSQFVQETRDEIEAVVVIDPSRFDEEQAALLTKNIRDRLGAGVRVKISPVESLPRTANGKVRQAICKVQN